MIINVTFEMTNNQWNVQEEPSTNNTIRFFFVKDGTYVEHFDNLRYGYQLFDGDNLVSEETTPGKQMMDNQVFITQVTYPHNNFLSELNYTVSSNTNYTLKLWCKETNLYSAYDYQLIIK